MWGLIKIQFLAQGPKYGSQSQWEFPNCPEDFWFLFSVSFFLSMKGTSQSVSLIFRDTYASPLIAGQKFLQNHHWNELTLVTSVSWLSEKIPSFLTLNVQVRQLKLNKGSPAQHKVSWEIHVSDSGCIGMNRKGGVGKRQEQWLKTQFSILPPFPPATAPVSLVMVEKSVCSPHTAAC